MKKILFLALLVFISYSGFSQWQKVNVGATPNDKTGDPLRTAFVKVNHNDSLLFDTLNLFIPFTDTLLNGKIYSRYFINAALLNKINWSDTLISGKIKSKYQTDYLANFGSRVLYNNDTILYVPKNKVRFPGSLFIGNGGGYIEDGVNPGNPKYNTAAGFYSQWNQYGGNYNTSLGYGTLKNAYSGDFNTSIGYQNIFSKNTGGYNTSVGAYSLYSDITGVNNTVIGYNSASIGISIRNHISVGNNNALFLTTGQYNIMIGNYTGNRVLTGLNNIVIGDYSMGNNSGNPPASSGSSTNNTIIGSYCGASGGYNNSVLIGRGTGYNSQANKGLNQTGQIKIGYQTGSLDTTNNRLYIENSSSQTPLIGGKFDIEQLGVNKLITATWKATFNVGGSLDVTGAIYHTQLTGSLTDGTPTAAEINAVTALTPATATAGYKIEILDSDGTGLIYDITSDGTNWQYLTRTKAL